MNPDIHKRAQELIAAALVEGLSSSDQAWLDEHLSTCLNCAQSDAGARRAIQALRWVAVSADPALVEATQRRVRLRALELGERQQRWLPVAVFCGLAAMLSLVTLTSLWQGFAWLGEQWRVPALAWQVGCVSVWFLPTSLAAVALWMQSRTAANGNGGKMHWAPSAGARRGER